MGPTIETEERAARRALRFVHLTERLRLIAEVVIDHTLAVGETHALIPKQSFAAMTDMDVRDVTRILAELASLQIVIAHDAADTYSFQADSRQWSAERRHISPVASQKVLPAFLLLQNDLKSALAELGRETVAAELSQASGGNLPPEPGGKLPPDHSDIYTRVPGYPVPGTRYTLRETRSRDLEATRVGGDLPPSGQYDEGYFIQRLTALLGASEMQQHGGLWRLRFREAPGALQEAIAATVNQRDSGGFRTNAAAYATMCYKRARQRSATTTATPTMEPKYTYEVVD